MAILIGDNLPEAVFKEKTSDGMAEVSVKDIFDGKKIVLFAVPGAYTPTCHSNHLPGYLENRDAILAKGVDDIAVVSVNDAHTTSLGHSEAHVLLCNSVHRAGDNR